MSAVPLKLQISGKNEKSASLGLRQVLCRLRGRYGKILLTAEAVFFLSAWELPYQGWDQRLAPSAEKIGCRFLWKSCACTLSVIAIRYIVPQSTDFVKGKCEICKEEKCLKAFFKLYVLRGRLHNGDSTSWNSGLKRRPFVNTRNQRKYPLDTSVKFSRKLRTILPI